eukprot:TRINITY_DN42023_c0_g1_i1.p1 TRINITY_DN42023_c0_g1~~TRINITY_DN42023_c0_g1_i1.p1  ORF type:complete len:122 (+),score=35.60 TRINITY_DN42023_c0_g1_i1:38-403(+)
MEVIDIELRRVDTRRLRKKQWESKWGLTDGLQNRMQRSGRWLTVERDSMSAKEYDKMPARLMHVYDRKDEYGNRRVYMATNNEVHYTAAHHRRLKEKSSNRSYCNKMSVQQGFEQNTKWPK